MASVLTATGAFSTLDATPVVHHHGVERRHRQDTLNVKQNPNANWFPEVLAFAGLGADSADIPVPAALRIIRDVCEALIGDQQSVESSRGFQIGTTV